MAQAPSSPAILTRSHQLWLALLLLKKTKAPGFKIFCHYSKTAIFKKAFFSIWNSPS